MRTTRVLSTLLALTATLALTGATAAYASGGGGGTTTGATQSQKVDTIKVVKA